MRPLTCPEIDEQALIERYLADRLPEDQGELLEAHYLTCARCYDEIRFVAAVREALPLVMGAAPQRPVTSAIDGSARSADSGAIASRPGSGWRRMGGRLRIVAAGAVATAAVLGGLMVVRPARDPRGPPSAHRADSAVVAGAPELRAPIGEAASAREFLWTGMSGADLYRVTLYDARGSVIWESETTDTSDTLPAGVGLEPGVPYLWEVGARIDWDRWVHSDLARFTVHAR